MRDNTEIIIQRITDMLLESGYRNTDEIFDELLQSHNAVPYTEQMVATAIIELTRNRGIIYHKYLGVDLYVKLWEKWSGDKQVESIIYLTTTQNTEVPAASTLHPYIAVVSNLGFCASRHQVRVSTRVRKEDVISLEKSSETFYQLKDLLERTMNGVKPTATEVKFLVQLSNYWAFSWKDLSDEENGRRNSQCSISVYLLEDHIVSPSMNCLARDLKVHEYQPSRRFWITTKTESMKGVFLVRYGTFIWSYRNFNFFNEPDFRSLYAGKVETEQKETNGIILVKGYYNPERPDAAVTSAAEYVKNLFSRSISSLQSISKKIIIKEFSIPTSRGSQIVNQIPEFSDRTKEAAFVSERLETIVGGGIALPFFLYDIDKSIHDGDFNIISLKLQEMRQMRLASEGKPPLRFKIFAVESRVINPREKQELYKRIYRIPDELE
jgi:hypothetical protein